MEEAKKVTATLKVVATGEFFDNEASEETVRFFVEQYLEDSGFDVEVKLLKEQEERKGNYVPCKVKTPTGKWNGEKCSVCGTKYIGSAPHQWKFCPDCGAKMEVG